MPTPLLFEPISFRSVTARNRIVRGADVPVFARRTGSAMTGTCQHLGARAMGGAGIVFTEATHVSAIGRITHHCLGLWNAQHQALLTRLAAIITPRRCGARHSARPRRTQGKHHAHLGRQQADRAAGWWLGAGRAQSDRVPSRRRRSARAHRRRNRGHRHAVRHLGANGVRGRHEGRGDSRCARLPAAFIPLANLESPQRRLRRRSATDAAAS